MSEVPVSPAAIAEVLGDMLAADGYRAIVRSWPEEGVGHPRIEIVATQDACPDCLVPKAMLKLVLQDRLPPGLVIDEEDLLYPNERPERSR
jgi:hypothetical protein